MAYPFPVTYPGYYSQLPQMSPTQMSGTSQQNNSIIWVQGEAGAKSYLLTPNTTLPLWDSEANVIYLKSTDASGMPSIKVLDYTVRGDQKPTQDAVSFATKEEVESLAEQLASMKKRLDGLSQRHRKPDKQKEVVNE